MAELIDGERIENDLETPCPVCGSTSLHGTGCPNFGRKGPWPTTELLLSTRMAKRLASSEAARAKAEAFIGEMTHARDLYKEHLDTEIAAHDATRAERDSAVAREAATAERLGEAIRHLHGMTATHGEPCNLPICVPVAEALAFLSPAAKPPCPHDALACPCCMAAAETTDPETHSHFERARDRRRALSPAPAGPEVDR